MSAKNSGVVAKSAWLLQTMSPEHPALRALRAETDREDYAGMATDPVQGRILAMLVQLSGAKRILEIGTFKGYGALAMALALPDDGSLVTLDVNADWGDAGRVHWQKAGVAGKITQRIGMAAETLETMAAETPRPMFDFVYIDADKKRYPDYVEAVLPMLRPGGFLTLDNLFWGGDVLDPANETKQAVNLRELSLSLGQDPRFASFCILPVADGLGMAIKAQ